MGASENYSEEGPRRVVILSACILWFVLSVCTLSVRTARLVSNGEVRCSIAPFCGYLVKVCKSSMILLAGGSDDGDPVAKQVHEELQKRRLTRAHNWIPYGSLVAWIIVGVVFARTRTPGPRQNSLVQDVSLLVSCFTMLTLRAFPQAVTLRTLDVWSSVMAGCIVLWLSPIAMEDDVVAASVLMPFGAMMVLSLFNLNLRVNLVWLFLMAMSTSGTILLGTEDPLQADTRGRTRMQDVTHVVTSAVMFGTMVVCFHQSIVLVAQYEIEAGISRNELHAARSVLRCVCDVVLELDGDFRLQDECPQLIDLLLLNPHRSLKGEDVMSFLASEQDQQKFSEQMVRQAKLHSEDNASMSAAFHVSMRDSSSVNLVVEVFSVCFVNREGQAAYFVGIREFTDTEGGRMQTDLPSEVRRGAVGNSQATGPEMHDRSSTNELPVTVEPSDSVSQSSRESSDINSEAFSWTAEDMSDLGQAEPVAWVDVLSPGYTVKHATQAFSRHLQVNSEMLAAVRPSKRSDFIAWAQEAYFELLEAGSGEKQYHERIHLKSKSAGRQPGVPRSQKTKQMISASVRLDLTPPPDEELSAGVVRIVLVDLQMISGVLRERSNAPRQQMSGTPSAIAVAASGQLRGQEEDAQALGKSLL